jgi:hypothetical protein
VPAKITASVLQVDGYAGYNALADPARPGEAVTLAYCWSHLRRKFYEVYVGGHSPIATEALADHVQLAAATRADLALRLDHHLLVRQLIELLVATGTALPRGGLAFRVRLLGVGLGSGRLKLIEGERQLVVADALGPAAELRAFELGDDVRELAGEALPRRAPAAPARPDCRPACGSRRASSPPGSA